MYRIIVLIVLFVVGCGTDKSQDPEGGSADGVIKVKDGDPEMSAAIKTAKASFAFFEKNWETMENDGCSFKIPMDTTDGKKEHIWFSPTKIAGDKITGRCANDPVKIPGLKLGDSRTFAKSEISDWMIVVGDQCYGGYTIRVLGKRNPKAAPPFKYVDPPK